MLVFVLVLLFTSPTSEHQTAIGYFTDAASCNAAKVEALKEVVADGAAEVGASCVAVNVAKVS